ncbi:HNH endonuclease signature motif containing protein [Mycobacterium sp. SMC-4]|uniref:HNH endonuclease signature motif containing protein n=1 Tax=Mycobacterium sp. SMC-4 TaxID=2857059 RepID=UPI0021B3F3E8|nr:HNH endonuclease signature motif containing protein [Mycobacterium sp. SMC-4]UXA19138.1 HNH endonuclease [Mycobacterium sp. SMC-4]
MSSVATDSGADVGSPAERLAVLFDEVAELCGQRNAIDGRLVQIVAEIDRDGLWGITGCRSLASLVAWKTGCSPRNAETLVAIADRLTEFPRCVGGLREGRLSLDQVGLIAQRAGAGSDEHYAELAQSATVTQLRTAIKLEPRPDPDPRPQPRPSISTRVNGDMTCWTIWLPTIESAKLEAGLASQHDGLIADWKRDHTTNTSDPADDDGEGPGARAPMPTRVDAFMALVEAGWDTEVAARPHGQHTTVIVHVDVTDKIAALHLGPLLSDAERQYLGCDATCETWFERHGQVIGSGRTTRTISRRLRRALEYRHPSCAVPGCGATRGLHAHHLRHWEDGGPTDLDNLVLLCPWHHRAHHRGAITITGTGHNITVTDSTGQALQPGSLARPPTTTAPDVPPYPGPTGERAHWWWYDPYQPPPPTHTN